MFKFGIKTLSADRVLDPLPDINNLLTDLLAIFTNIFVGIGAAFEALFSIFS